MTGSQNENRFRVGIDIGGTFTDFACIDHASGRLTVHKQLSTPQEPADSVLSGLPLLLRQAGLGIDQITQIIHGTTLVTNAVIERKGARTGMLCTAGFGDVMDIALERRYDIYDMRIRYPEPLVAKALRCEIDERIAASGDVLQALDPEQVERQVDALIRLHRIEALAVCLLNSYANDIHEQHIAEIVRTRFPWLALSTSADVVPFMREYERWNTTAMNAFVQPLVSDYLQSLQAGLSGLGFRGSMLIMTSSGGTITPELARRYPVRLLESGPAAGVLVAAFSGERFGFGELLSFDMGGTTAKGAIIRNGIPLKRYDMEVARVHEFKMGSGLPVKIPVLDLIEIGAGGGSLAKTDIRGVISVGPESAGAVPGPACYALGGEQPTLTDANLVLGYLDDRSFLGGEMALDKTRAERALTGKIADALAVGTARAAWGVHETINEDVARAFRNHAAERGFDYRRAAMVAFGGSGPVHASRVARKLRVPKVIFPAAAGVLSAVGLLLSPLAFEVMRSAQVALEDLSEHDVDRLFAPLVAQAKGQLQSAGVGEDDIEILRQLDMRYRGQGYEIEVLLPAGVSDPLALPELFADVYAEVFARSFPDEPLQIVNWKVTARAASPLKTGIHIGPGKILQTAEKSRPVFFPEQGAYVDCPVICRYALAPGDTLTGPALIEERESTCIIGFGDRMRVDAFGNLLVDVFLEEVQA